MSFDKEVLGWIQTHKEQVQKQVAEIQAIKQNLTPTEIEAIIPLQQAHYKEQMAKPMNERIWYSDAMGRDYIIIQTDAQGIKNKEGVIWNGWESDEWPDGTPRKKISAVFPLKDKLNKTEGEFSKRVNVTWSEPPQEEYDKIRKWNLLALISGKMKVVCKHTTDTGKPIPLGAYLASLKLENFLDLDFTETIVYYNFTMYQCLLTAGL